MHYPFTTRPEDIFFFSAHSPWIKMKIRLRRGASGEPDPAGIC